MQHIPLEKMLKNLYTNPYNMSKPKNSYSPKMNLIRMQSVSSKTELIMK